jgi:hypothetical protein
MDLVFQTVLAKQENLDTLHWRLQLENWPNVSTVPPPVFRMEADLKYLGMNLLSGSTWKGAKLRFGEAKPDFKER